MLEYPPREGFFRRKLWNVERNARLAVRREALLRAHSRHRCQRPSHKSSLPRARSLKSSSEERIEMRVCETPKRASYRSVAAVPALLWWVSLISIRGFDLTAFHKCLSPENRKTKLVRIRAVNKIHPRGHRRHSTAAVVDPRTLP